MATIQIRDVPDDVHESLQRLARSEGQSLASYLRREVTALARARSRQVAAAQRIEARRPAPVSTSDVLEALDHGRRNQP